MLSRVSRALPSLSSRSYQVVIGRRAMSGLSDKLHSKGHVEEDRYMKAQEEAWKEKLRRLKAQAEHEREEAVHDEVVSPVMADIQEMLKETGDSISKEGLEKLAKWKIDL